MNKDYIFHLNWEDRDKNSYNVGILARIQDSYYFILKGKEQAEGAYKNGFIGISGFQTEEIYASKELFDFFKSRILDVTNPCEELAKSGGISMIDSFSVEEVPERMVQKYKEIILKAYELQLKKVQLQGVKGQDDSDNKWNTLEDIE